MSQQLKFLAVAALALGIWLARNNSYLESEDGSQPPQIVAPDEEICRQLLAHRVTVDLAIDADLAKAPGLRELGEQLQVDPQGICDMTTGEPVGCGKVQPRPGQRIRVVIDRSPDEGLLP